jgi:hypothetical protein
MTAYFPMPFAKQARIEVTGSERSSGLYYIWTFANLDINRGCFGRQC